MLLNNFIKNYREAIPPLNPQSLILDPFCILKRINFDDLPAKFFVKSQNL